MPHSNTSSAVEPIPLSGFEVTVLLQVASGFPIEAVLNEQSWADRFGSTARKIARVIACKQAEPKYRPHLLPGPVTCKTVRRGSSSHSGIPLGIMQAADEFLQMAMAR